MKQIVIFQVLLLLVTQYLFCDSNLEEGPLQMLSYDKVVIYYQPFDILTGISKDTDYLKNNYYYKAEYTNKTFSMNQNILEEILSIQNREEVSEECFDPKFLMEIQKGDKTIGALIVGQSKKVIIDGKYYNLGPSDFENLMNFVPLIFQDDFKWLYKIIKGDKTYSDDPLI